jgi:2-polyprenyl-6-methoxyphenol hydroxylase-like FAD-dependent oxidoreductase
MYDVIVVGARCAGASTAMLLARQGHRVLVLERARFPSDKLSTLYIHQPGVARLADWDVLDEVIDTGCPPLDRPLYQVGDVRLHGRGPEVGGNRAAYGPRRHLLDQILADAAAKAGAEVRTSCTLLGLSTEDGRVTGVRFRDERGAVRTESCRLVVGADGMRSAVARLAGAQEYSTHPKLSCAYYTYWSGVPAGFEQYQRVGHWIGVIPTNNDQVLVAAYFRQHEFGRIRADATSAYLDNIRRTAPQLYERLAGADRDDRMYGTGDQLNYLRTAAGRGWALVGDAGHHKDSLTARGITDAFIQAELLADCVGDPDTGMPLDLALRRYAQRRDMLLEDNYRATVAVAKLTVDEDRLAVLRRVQDSEELTERYFAAAAGVLSAEDFYNHELLAHPAA